MDSLRFRTEVTRRSESISSRVKNVMQFVEGCGCGVRDMKRDMMFERGRWIEGQRKIWSHDEGNSELEWTISSRNFWNANTLMGHRCIHIPHRTMTRKVDSETCVGPTLIDGTGNLDPSRPNFECGSWGEVKHDTQLFSIPSYSDTLRTIHNNVRESILQFF